MDSKSTFSFKALCSGHHQKMILEIMRIHYTARGIRGVVCFLKTSSQSNVNFLLPLVTSQEPIVRSGQVHMVVALDFPLNQGYCCSNVISRFYHTNKRLMLQQ